MEEKLLPAEEEGVGKNLPFRTRKGLNSPAQVVLFTQFDLARIEGRLTFGELEKLKSQKTLEELFEKGKSVTHNGFTLVYLPIPLKTFYPVQAGFSVPKRNFKHAVDRNRIKRLMRETYRHQKFDLYQKLVAAKKQLAIMWVYKGKTVPNHETVNASMLKCLEKLSGHL